MSSTSDRLVPPIGLTVGLYATVMRFWVTGPMRSLWDISTYTYCQDYWWRDILFLDNFYFGEAVVSGSGGLRERSCRQSVRGEMMNEKTKTERI